MTPTDEGIPNQIGPRKRVAKQDWVVEFSRHLEGPIVWGLELHEGLAYPLKTIMENQ
jgi:hypothetical protein